MSETAEKTKDGFDPNTLNIAGRFLWFDDLGTNNPHAFLSNFYAGEPLRVSVLPGVSFRTGEHLFAALKARDSEGFYSVVDAEDPNDCKSAGRSLSLRTDWERVKYDAMRLVLALKFTLEREEGQKLLATGDALLVEGTFWGDTVWGVDLTTPLSDDDEDPAKVDYPGRNWLGTLLMARRAELRAEQAGVTLFSTTDDLVALVATGDFLGADRRVPRRR